jgi:uncharacterized protein
MRSTCLALIFVSAFLTAAYPQEESNSLKKLYSKKEVYIPMRDGAQLYTAIYSPRDTSVKYPILMVKTPYGIKPYGKDNFPEHIGPSEYLEKEKYIFVHQDARGMFLSTGVMDQMTPHLEEKPDSSFVDNSTDTWDAVEWLMKHTRNNGNVGLWGISYRGFYAASGIIDAHPAIKCSSPQAPIADWYTGDDMHHNGAFSLLPAFSFLEVVGQKQDSMFTEWPDPFSYPVRDAYNFFLNLGKLSEVSCNYFQNKVPFWDSIIAHPDYDRYWQERNIRPHLRNIRPAVMVTGGLFDHENLYGSLQTYQSIKQNSNNDTRLILGPWIHGGWARTAGDRLGAIDFGSPTSDYYQREIEAPFFNHYLKGKGLPDGQSTVSVFITGINRWSFYKSWPPYEVKPFSFYLDEGYALSYQPPEKSGFVFDEYISDPEHPVPYTQFFHPVQTAYNKDYMIEDQRFAAARPDVLSYTTSVLKDTLIFQGPVEAILYISSSSSDYDIIVKIIDVYPDTINPAYHKDEVTEMAGFYQLVRAEIFRARYRNSYEDPEAVIPQKIENITFQLNDISHAFLPGHRIMVQIQSSWFPLYDRNPQKFTNIYEAEEKDFRKAEIQIYRSGDYPSTIKFNKLPD